MDVTDSAFGRILAPVDNSRFSELSFEMALSLAEKFGSAIVGFHAYAAQLHEGRFQQLETSLPDKYQQVEAMERQRQAHTSLILHGLELVSRSYLDGCAKRCRIRGILFEGMVAEGKNYAEIVRAAADGHDLVVMGAQGLGREEGQRVGSVCLRVARRLSGANILVAREEASLAGRTMVALDGSAVSQQGFLLALHLAKAFGGEIEGIAAYDPCLHNRVFRNLVGVLSEEAGQLFHFQEQERLHEEVIDKGMAKLSQEHLYLAQKLAEQEGVRFQGELLKGKAATAIPRYVQQRRPCLVVAGRYGAHRTEGLDLGSTAEALLLYSSANLLLAGGPSWSPYAQKRLEQVPQGMMRELTRQRVEEMAKRMGKPAVTSEVVEAKYSQWADGSAKAQSKLAWSTSAKERTQRVPEFIRGMVIESIEDYARMKGAAEVTTEMVDEAKARWESTGTIHHE